jgi:hypothetical protein
MKWFMVSRNRCALASRGPPMRGSARILYGFPQDYCHSKMHTNRCLHMRQSTRSRRAGNIDNGRIVRSREILGRRPNLYTRRRCCLAHEHNDDHDFAHDATREKCLTTGNRVTGTRNPFSIQPIYSLLASENVPISAPAYFNNTSHPSQPHPSNSRSRSSASYPSSWTTSSSR